MINVFCGYDERESIGFHVFLSSILAHTLAPVAIKRMDSRDMPVGSNAFTFSRFLVPYLMGFKGHAIFADASDMLLLRDIADLDALFDERCAVQVVKHSYKTRHPIKYRGTDMQCPNRDYPRKNWASLMLINCEHPAWRVMHPHTVANYPALNLLQLDWMRHDEIGALPPEWNVLADEGQQLAGAALLHWTAGIPHFDQYRATPGAEQWNAALQSMLNASS